MLYFDKLSTLQTCQFTCNFHKNSSSNAAELEPVTSINNHQEYRKLTDTGKAQLNESGIKCMSKYSLGLGSTCAISLFACSHKMEANGRFLMLS